MVRTGAHLLSVGGRKALKSRMPRKLRKGALVSDTKIICYNANTMKKIPPAEASAAS
jgi:hypothetical protein